MGSPPPEDEPAPEEQDAETSAASFSASPSGAELCGFPLGIDFAFNLNFPGIQVPSFTFPPAFALPFALSCDIDKAIDAPDGGGREGTTGLSDDPEFGPV